MQREMQIILEVNSQAESFYEEATRLGDHAAHALGGKHRAQMTNLESVAESAFKASDVLDYVKRQTGRFSYWQQRAPATASFRGAADEVFGERLKNYLEQDLAKRRDIICKDRLAIGQAKDEDRAVRRHVYLLLIRQFVRQMVVQYEYRVGFAGASEKEGER